MPCVLFRVLISVLMFCWVVAYVEPIDNILILHTISGSFIGVDVSKGSELWCIPGAPLISQSLSNLRLLTKSHDYSLVPSLDGQLFLLERNIPHTTEWNASLNALPLTVESLFTSKFMLTEDSILTGSKESSLFAFDPVTGKVQYNCSRDGCVNTSTSQNPNEDPNDEHRPMLLIYHVNQIVRAIHIPTGSEKWNLGIRNNDLCVVRSPLSASTTAIGQNAPTCGVPPGDSKDDPAGHTSDKFAADPESILNELDIEFTLDDLLITARTKAPFARQLWSYEASSRIAKSWLYNTRSRTLKSIRIFPRDGHTDRSKEEVVFNRADWLSPVHVPNRKKTLTDYIRLPGIANRLKNRRHRECPSRDRLVYLGVLNDQLYVQLEDGFDGPSPTHINFPKLSTHSKPVPHPLPFTDTHTATDSHATMVGYYRASYSPFTSRGWCQQPFLTDQSDPSNTLAPSASQTGLALWHPTEGMPYSVTSSPDDLDDNAEEEEVPQSSGDPNLNYDRHSDGPSNWMLHSANDLFMLLMRASELSDQQLREARRRTPSFLDRFGPALHITILVVLLHAVDRLFRVFHDHLKSTASTSTSVVPFQVITTTLVSPQTSHCPTCSSSNHSSDCTVNREVPSTQSTVQHGCTSCGTQSSLDFHSTYESEFLFIRCLGRGGFGRVFEVENRFDGCRYAIKRIQMDRTREDKNTFLREVKALASLDHPGIVRYHRAWTESPPPGWQEARDQANFGHSEEDTETDFGGSFLNSIKTSCNPTGDDAKSDSEPQSQSDDLLLYERNHHLSATELINGQCSDDSLIVFEHPDQSQPMPEPHPSVCYTTTGFRDRSTSLPSSDLPHLSYLYIQMQLCSQLSLRDWLLSYNETALRPSRTELYGMFRQIVDAVAYLHDHAFMHRDLKPSNILFDLTHRLKLADFGLVTSILDDDDDYEISHSVPQDGPTHPSSMAQPPSQAQGDYATSRSSDAPVRSLPHRDIKHVRTHTRHVGTDLYMSPEQKRGDPYDYKVDIFSLGLIFIELLIPFQTNMERVQTLTEAKLQLLPADLIRNHHDETVFVLQLLDALPANRPSAREILASPLLSESLLSNVPPCPS